MRTLRTEVPALAALAALCSLLYWKLVWTGEFTWLDSPDFVNQVLPWFQEQIRQARGGAFPLWDSHHWAGYPIPGQSQPGALFPLNWLLAVTGMKTVWLNLYYVILHVAAAFSCYWLCRDLRRSRTASVIGGVLFGCAGFVGNTGWPQMLNGAVPAPLILLFLFRMADGRRIVVHAFAAGAALGVSLWSGHHQVPIFVGLAAAAVLGLARAPLRAVCAFGAAAFLFGAPQLLTAREFYTLALRWVGSQNPVTWADRVPYAVHTNYSLCPGQVAGLVIPFWYGNVTLYVGLTAVLLAGCAVWRMRDLFAVRALAWLAAGSLIYSFGANGALQAFLYAVVPAVDKARNVAFAVMVLHLSVSVLAAFGADWLSRVRERSCTWIAGGFGGILLAYVATRSLLAGEAGSVEAGTAAAGSACAFALLFCALSHARPLSTAAMLAFVVLETGIMTGANFKSREGGWPLLDRLNAHDDIGAWLRAHIGTARMDRDSAEIPHNFGDWHGIDERGGYISPLTSVFRTNTDSSTLGVRFWVATKPRFAGQRVLFTGSSGVSVWDEPNALPRAWSVHHVSPVSQDPRFSATVAGEPPPPLRNCAEPDSVRVRTLRPTRIVIDAAMACDGLVVLSDAAFPGWRAQIDGKRVPLVVANGFMRSAFVRSGRHTLEFVYTPWSLYTGCALLTTGVAVLVVLSSLDRSDSATRMHSSRVSMAKSA